MSSADEASFVTVRLRFFWSTFTTAARNSEAPGLLPNGSTKRRAGSPPDKTRTVSNVTVTIHLGNPRRTISLHIVRENRDSLRCAQKRENLTETTLAPDNVNASSFGRLFTLSEDGKVDEQPLYASNVAIAGQGTYNVSILVTTYRFQRRKLELDGQCDLHR